MESFEKIETPGFPVAVSSLVCCWSPCRCRHVREAFPGNSSRRQTFHSHRPCWLLLLMATYHHFAYLFACSLSDRQESVRTEASLFLFLFLFHFWLCWVFVAVWRLSLVVVRGLLIAGSCCGAWALKYKSFSSRGAWTQLLCSMWDLPGPEIKPTSPTLTGRFLTTGPPKRSWLVCFESPESRTVHIGRHFSIGQGWPTFSLKVQVVKYVRLGVLCCPYCGHSVDHCGTQAATTWINEWV